MGDMGIEELNLWARTEDEARKNYLMTMDARRAYRAARILELAAHPELPNLFAVEAALHGYAGRKDTDPDPNTIEDEAA
jgi:hypothetical protein